MSTPHLNPAGTLLDPQSVQQAIQSKRSLRSGFITDYSELFKFRVTLMVVITAWAGYYLAAYTAGISRFSSVLNQQVLETVIGVAMVSCGSSALNQVLERRLDARMLRTAHRPLAAGRMTLTQGIVLGMLAIVVGSIWLAYFTNIITGTLTLFTAIGYVAIYTPLKRATTIATFIGAFPGAMPPLIGWTAARGQIEWPAVALFAILFIWQFPHFMSIAWLYREDYGRAGIRMLPVVEPDGWSTSLQALIYAVLMIPVSLAPVWLGMAGWIYGGAAIVLGLGYLWFAIRFLRITRAPEAEISRTYARDLLKFSVSYLPLLLAFMMLNAKGKMFF
jgi:protoheme IX farnesyltransferase